MWGWVRVLAAVGVAVVVLAGCGRGDDKWSALSPEPGEGWLVTGTLGLALMRGPSGKIKFTLGPEGSQWGPDTAEVKADLQHLAMLPVGRWRLIKGDTSIVLPSERSGFVRTHDLYENLEPQMWALLTSPGCSTLEGSLTQASSQSVLVQRTYKLCGVDQAVARLRAAAVTAD